MNIGMVRKIDDLGRVVIPAETRRLFKIREGDELAFSIDNNAIVIRKLAATCLFCGSMENVTAFKERGVCARCKTELAAD